MTVPSRLVLFDGECIFCDRSMHWLVRLDRKAVFRVAALQDPAVQALPGFEYSLRSVVLVEDGHFTTGSDAILGICRGLPFPFPLLAFFGRWIPRPLRDAAYFGFAAIRYRVLGSQEYCPAPSAQLRDRVWQPL